MKSIDGVPPQLRHDERHALAIKPDTKAKLRDSRFGLEASTAFC
jgi:hypothetical protein